MSVYEHEMMAECVWHNYYRLCHLVTLTYTSVPGCQARDFLDLGLGGAIHHARDNLGCPRLSQDKWDILGLGLGGVQGQPRMSWVSGVVAGTTLAFDGNPR